MLELLKFADARLREPSSWAGLATLLGLLHVSVSPGVWADVTLWGTGAAGVLAIVLNELGTKPTVGVVTDALKALVAALPASAPAKPADPAAPATKAAAAVAIALLIGAGLALSACTTQQLAATQQAAAAGGTLLQLAAANNRTVADLVIKGQPFCKKADGTIVAVSAVTGNPIVGALAGTLPYGALTLSVINATETGVRDLCAMVEAVPAPPPADVPIASVPVAVVPAAAAAVALKPAG